MSAVPREAPLGFCVVSIHPRVTRVACCPVAFPHVCPLSLSVLALLCLCHARTQSGARKAFQVRTDRWVGLCKYSKGGETVEIVEPYIGVCSVTDFRHHLFLCRYVWNSSKMRSGSCSRRTGLSCLHSVCFKVKGELSLVLRAIWAQKLRQVKP